MVMCARSLVTEDDVLVPLRPIRIGSCVGQGDVAIDGVRHHQHPHLNHHPEFPPHPVFHQVLVILAMMGKYVIDVVGRRVGSPFVFLAPSPVTIVQVRV